MLIFCQYSIKKKNVNRGKRFSEKSMGRAQSSDLSDLSDQSANFTPDFSIFFKKLTFFGENRLTYSSIIL